MKSVKIVLAILLLLCLAHMPYGYYQFMRIAVCAGMIYLVYTEHKRPTITILCVIAGILFNPIKPIYLPKDTWHVVDAIVAILLLLWVIIDLVTLHYAQKD